MLWRFYLINLRQPKKISLPEASVPTLPGTKILFD